MGKTSSIKEKVAKKAKVLPEVIDKQNRATLFEGKNYQMGFAFAKKVDDAHYETIMPVTACKDYLNEVVYTEVSGIDSEAYGFSHKKMGLWGSNDVWAYVVMKILPYNKGSEYPKMKEDVERLEKNLTKVELLMRHVDNMMGIPLDGQTRITHTATANLYLIFVPIFWSKFTYLISLYTLLLRMAQFFDQSKSPHEFLENFKDCYGDQSMWVPAKLKLEKLAKLAKANKLPPQDFKKKWCPHNVGILGFNF